MWKRKLQERIPNGPMVLVNGAHSTKYVGPLRLRKGTARCYVPVIEGAVTTI